MFWRVYNKRNEIALFEDECPGVRGSDRGLENHEQQQHKIQNE